MINLAPHSHRTRPVNRHLVCALRRHHPHSQSKPPPPFPYVAWYLTHRRQLFFGQMILYTTTHFFVRSSIIFFYMRIFSPRADNKLGRILLFTMIFNVVYNVSFLIAVVLQCSPISYSWTQWEGLGDGRCGNLNVLVWVSAVTGVLFDFWLMALPFPQLFALNLSWRKKVLGGAMFFVGAAVIIIDLVRFKTIIAFNHSSNPTGTFPSQPAFDLISEAQLTPPAPPRSRHRAALPLVRHRAQRRRHLPLPTLLPPAAAPPDAQPHGLVGPPRRGPHHHVGVGPGRHWQQRHAQEFWRRDGAEQWDPWQDRGGEYDCHQVWEYG